MKEREVIPPPCHVPTPLPCPHPLAMSPPPCYVCPHPPATPPPPHCGWCYTYWSVLGGLHRTTQQSVHLEHSGWAERGGRRREGRGGKKRRREERGGEWAEKRGEGRGHSYVGHMTNLLEPPCSLQQTRLYSMDVANVVTHLTRLPHEVSYCGVIGYQEHNLLQECYK